VGQCVFHVFNRAIQALVLFERRAQYDQFLGVLRQAAHRQRMRVLAYVVMPNHWHLVVWPLHDGDLAAFMQWLTVTHAKRWREGSETTGRGAVYQGRYRAVPIQRDGHLLTACAYVERNPLRAGLVDRAEDWPWSSASPEADRDDRPALSPWPVPKPADWNRLLDQVPSRPEVEAFRNAIRRGVPFGSVAWSAATNRRLPWTIHAPGGRPRSTQDPADVPGAIKPSVVTA
jgi:putative transposase